MSSADASLEQTLREILLAVPVNKKHKYSDVVFQSALSSLLVAAGLFPDTDGPSGDRLGYAAWVAATTAQADLDPTVYRPDKKKLTNHRVHVVTEICATYYEMTSGRKFGLSTKPTVPQSYAGPAYRLLERVFVALKIDADAAYAIKSFKKIRSLQAEAS